MKASVTYVKWCMLALGLGLALARGATSFGQGALVVKQEPDRVVLHWSGAVQEPMLERFTQAFRQFEGDPRRLVISLNSLGGLVEHGRDVMRLVHNESRKRQIDSVVESGKVCASMCVPIYLVGAERWAGPAAKFMFHEASFGGRRPPNSAYAGAVLSKVTDQLFEDDIGDRSVDNRWLTQMRQRIRSGDVWLTGRQLMDQGSGVVDKLLVERTG